MLSGSKTIPSPRGFMKVRLAFFRVLLVMTIAMSTPSLLLDYLVYKTGLSDGLVNFAIFIIAGLVALDGLKQFQLTSFQRQLFNFFIVVSIYFLINWNIEIFQSGGARQIFRAFLYGPILLIIVSDKRFPFEKLSYFLVLLAFILALLSVIQYFGVLTGFLSLSEIQLGGREDLKVGIGGFQAFDFMLVPRNQGFYSEPTNFAQFLMVPMFIAAFRLTKNRSLKNIVFLLVIVIAFITTFSVANFFGVFIGLVLFFFYRSRNSYYLHFRKSSRIFNFLVFVGLIYAIVAFFQFTNVNSSEGNVMLGKDTTSNVENRIGRNKVYFDRIKEHPFGDLAFKREVATNSGFIGIVAVIGGYPLLIIMFFFIVLYFLRIKRQLKRSKYLIIYTGFISYFIPGLWDVQFFETYFIFLLVFIASLDKLEVQKTLNVQNSNDPASESR